MSKRTHNKANSVFDGTAFANLDEVLKLNGYKTSEESNQRESLDEQDFSRLNLKE
jgi:hypothetical protein